MHSRRLDTAKSLLLACLIGTVALVASLGPSTSLAATATSSSTGTGGQSAPDSGGSSYGATSPNAGGLRVPTTVLLRQVAVISGTIGTSAGTAVAIERLDPLRGTWASIAAATTTANGSFSARWRADRPGTFTLRAVAGGASAASASAPAPTAQLTVARGAIATWFGPGFYGKRTACGEVMSPTLLGVAHRSLPCGTMVAISYGGRSITVPVVDRGPYAHGASWDLTTATAQALGFDQTARISALVDHSATAASAARAAATRQR